MWFGFSWLGTGNATVLDLHSFPDKIPTQMITFRIFEIFRTSEFWIHMTYQDIKDPELWLKASYLPSCWDGDGLCCWQASKCYDRDRNKAHSIPLETTNWYKLERSWILMEENAVFYQLRTLPAISWIWRSGLCGILLAFVVLLTIKAGTYYVYCIPWELSKGDILFT